jgi:hypothetical protein
MSLQNPSDLTPIQRETQSIKDLNALLEKSIVSISTVSDNLKTLSSNMENSKSLSNTYTDIYKINKRLNDMLNENNQKRFQSPQQLDHHIADLNNQIKSLENQLNGSQ